MCINGYFYEKNTLRKGISCAYSTNVKKYPVDFIMEMYESNCYGIIHERQFWRFVKSEINFRA